MLRKFAIGSAAAAFIAVAGIVSGTAPASAGVHVSVGIPGFFGFWAPGYYYAPPAPYYAPPPAPYYAPPARYYAPYARYYGPYGYYRPRYRAPYGYYRQRYYGPRYYGQPYNKQHYKQYSNQGRPPQHNWQ